ncbi:hypothetical protein CMT89_08335 [Elizabethkingia anophelis]|nr:hypothetical protein [Elizabethkingia anophelis]MDV4058425.1 hypothetical protein [Elizabethkingia anophelis]
MENAKHEAIKAAYGEYWEKLSEEAKDFVLSNDGYVSYWHWSHFNMDFDFDLKTGGLYRPKSLSGIETNNGWTRVESEDDLPKDRSKEDLLISTETGEVLVASSKYLSDSEIRRYWVKTVSHWQKLIKPNPPIF